MSSLHPEDDQPALGFLAVIVIPYFNGAKRPYAACLRSARSGLLERRPRE